MIMPLMKFADFSNINNGLRRKSRKTLINLGFPCLYGHSMHQAKPTHTIACNGIHKKCAQCVQIGNLLSAKKEIR